mmetsp:Transcript_79429/g.158598  ORF Transcript_79429/g.158598 Transcript_79429/m.158598 type:complete len:374 (-) Transcript_79429:142-1263(-)
MRLLLGSVVIVGVLTVSRGHDYIGTYGATENSPVVPLVSGCGRSGTHTAGELLMSLGIGAIHEGAGVNKVSVSWFYGTNESFRDPSIQYPLKDEPKKPVKLKNVDKLDKQLDKSGVRFHPIVHIVRHPLTHIETTGRCICAKGSRTDSERSMAWDVLSWNFAGAHVELKPGVSGELERSARYWLEWNEMVEKNPSTTTRLRIEDLNPRTLVSALDLPNSAVHFDPNRLGKTTAAATAQAHTLDLSLVPEELAIHASESKERDVLEWATLEAAIGPELSARVKAAALRYGYDDLGTGQPSSASKLLSPEQPQLAAVLHAGNAALNHVDFADETRGPDKGAPEALLESGGYGLTSVGLGRAMGGGHKGHKKSKGA